MPPPQAVSVFGRFSLDYFSLSGKGSLGALGGPGTGLLGLSGSSITHNYSLATGFTKTLNTSLLTDFRFGWFKYNPQDPKAGRRHSDDRLSESPMQIPAIPRPLVWVPSFGCRSEHG